MDVKEFEDKLHHLVGLVILEISAGQNGEREKAKAFLETGNKVFDELVTAFKKEVFRQ